MKETEGPNDPLKCELVTSDQMKVNPRNLQILEGEMNPDTLKKYKKTWLEFINMRNIDVDHKPEENDFVQYFETMRNRGCLGNYIKTKYSHLNKIYTRLYGTKLSYLSSRMYRIVESYCIDEPVKKHSKRFKSEEISRYSTGFFGIVSFATYKN